VPVRGIGTPRYCYRVLQNAACEASDLREPSGRPLGGGRSAWRGQTFVQIDIRRPWPSVAGRAAETVASVAGRAAEIAFRIVGGQVRAPQHIQRNIHNRLRHVRLRLCRGRWTSTN
jgi:hypothetical protein